MGATGQGMGAGKKGQRLLYTLQGQGSRGKEGEEVEPELAVPLPSTCWLSPEGVLSGVARYCTAVEGAAAAACLRSPPLETLNNLY